MSRYLRLSIALDKVLFQPKSIGVFFFFISL